MQIVNATTKEPSTDCELLLFAHDNVYLEQAGAGAGEGAPWWAQQQQRPACLPAAEALPRHMPAPAAQVPRAVPHIFLTSGNRAELLVRCTKPGDYILTAGRAPRCALAAEPRPLRCACWKRSRTRRRSFL